MGREENLIRIAKKLDKMVSRKSMDGALDLLQELRGVKMTLKLLQSTKIGMSVNAIRKHSTDEEVIALAKILIKNWKKLLASEIPADHKAVKAAGKEGEKKDKAPTVSPAPRKHHEEKCVERQDLFSSKPPLTTSPMSRKNSTDGQRDHQRRDSSSSMSPMTLSPMSRKNSTDTEERKDSYNSKSSTVTSPARRTSVDSSKEESGVGSKGKMESPSTPTSPTFSTPTILPPFLSTGESIRDKCIEMLIAALKTDDDYKDYGVNCDKMGAEIEDYIYQEFQKTDMKYKNRVRSRISNLKDPKNPNLRKNVLAGAIDLFHLAKMTAEEMASDELKELRNVITKEAIREHQMAKTGGTQSNLFQCGKCKKKNCTYNQVQTRSADEPMTTFVLCNECGNRWKFC
ncbi:transcription elongation factor A protein 3 isoform X1 [Chiloscyllium plagiosum]|uniref:transcription elongation factor A protein 3 isoform X1 n=1 Tax=Chiloscyllium plagiosum TaxID=36176 RepID=UPI001CB83EF4|nr:transcription elongation factor A protein 3 isoform X1 [Chiloscyllium plagiosum]XP_043573514.1 transcription elongation factor A protein 3 isoform X1 [Chiloscyllium plagiosum]